MYILQQHYKTKYDKYDMRSDGSQTNERRWICGLDRLAIHKLSASRVQRFKYHVICASVWSDICNMREWLTRKVSSDDCVCYHVICVISTGYAQIQSRSAHKHRHSIVGVSARMKVMWSNETREHVYIQAKVALCSAVAVQFIYKLLQLNHYEGLTSRCCNALDYQVDLFVLAVNAV